VVYCPRAVVKYNLSRHTSKYQEGIGLLAADWLTGIRLATRCSIFVRQRSDCRPGESLLIGLLCIALDLCQTFVAGDRLHLFRRGAVFSKSPQRGLSKTHELRIRREVPPPWLPRKSNQ
jgi:hypothetical protein